MPSTLWTAPAQSQGPLGFTAGPAQTAAALGDSSPVPPILVPPIYGVGSRLRVRAFGDYATASAPTSNVTMGIYWATPATAIATATVLAASTATAVVNTATVLWPWMLEWEGEFRALSTVVGTATGSIYSQGRLWLPTSLTAGTMQFLPVTAALRTVALDTSQTMKLSLGITLSATTGTPSMVCQHLNAELIG
jgi:hypothetical protein